MYLPAAVLVAVRVFLLAPGGIPIVRWSRKDETLGSGRTFQSASMRRIIVERPVALKSINFTALVAKSTTKIAAIA